MLEDPQKFRCLIFQKFCKRNFKNGFSGISQKVPETKLSILVILAPFLAKLQHKHSAAGQIDPVFPE